MAKKKSVKKTARKAAKAAQKSVQTAGKPPGKKPTAEKVAQKAGKKKAAVKKKATKKKSAGKSSGRAVFDRIRDAVLQIPELFEPEERPQPPAVVTELLSSIGIKDPAELDLQGVEEVARQLSGHPRWEEFRAGLLECFGMTGNEWYMNFDDSQPPMCYEVKVTLKHTKPAVERVLHVPEMSFGELHDCIQVAMGWQNCHLHEFEVGDDRVGPVPDEDDPLGAWGHDPEVLPEEDVAIGQAWQAGLKKIRYVYDFGDGWEHHVALVKAWPMNGDRPTPKCISGKLACPPEDCGSIPGYYELIELLQVPADELNGDDRERLDWLGDWDPQRFDIDQVNQVFAQWNTPVEEGDDDWDDDDELV